MLEIEKNVLPIISELSFADILTGFSLSKFSMQLKKYTIYRCGHDQLAVRAKNLETDQLWRDIWPPEPFSIFSDERKSLVIPEF